MVSRVAFAGIIVAALLVGALFGYGLYGRLGTNTQTTTAASYTISIHALNSSMTATAGSTADFMFNVTSPVVAPLYFYASSIPAPGSHTTMRLQNVTTGNIEVPSGVQVSYPTGQAIFGTSHAILTLRVTFSSGLNGTLGLVVGAIQEVSQEQTVGYGSGFYITLHQA